MAFRLKPYLLATVLAFLPLASIQSAHAFDYGYMADNYFATYHIDNAFQRNLWENQEKYGTGYKNAKKSSKKTTRSSGSTGSKSSNKADNNSTAHRYMYSSGISNQINNQMIAAMKSDLRSQGKLNSQTESQLNQLAKANLIESVKNSLKSDGYEQNSLATAMAYWVVVNYGISQRKDLAKLKAHGMVAQLQSAIGSDSGLSSLNNSEKQKMAEMLYWAGSLQMAMYLEALQSGNHKYINQSVDGAKQALGKMGISASQISDGSRGLEFR